MARVSLERVRKVYDNGFVAVHDVSLDVEHGEFVVLVGPSGCGKSTTLRMIAGLESITAGRLLIGDRQVNEVPASERDIAMVFQNYALYPHMSVYENMAFALKLRKQPRAEIDARVREAAAILGIEAILQRRPRQLSGGQRQRVAVGRAIVRQPQVFLFDEPLSNLDAKLRVQTRKEISRLHRQLGATMIYVTHDQVEAMTMGDRIVVLNEGHVQQVGTPLELYNRPANQFVAGFIGSPSMNFIAGELREHGDSLRFYAEHGDLQLRLPPHLATRLQGVGAGPAVVLGVRPEDIYVADGPYVPDSGQQATLQLDEVEPMGNEILLYASSDGQEVVARVAPQPLPVPDQGVRLAFDVARIHFFDRRTGAALPHTE